jgi:hypothetical protein
MTTFKWSTEAVWDCSRRLMEPLKWDMSPGKGIRRLRHWRKALAAKARVASRIASSNRVGWGPIFNDRYIVEAIVSRRRGSDILVLVSWLLSLLRGVEELAVAQKERRVCQTSRSSGLAIGGNRDRWGILSHLVNSGNDIHGSSTVSWKKRGGSPVARDTERSPLMLD